MPLILDEIARLRRAQTIILTPTHETNITRPEWEALLEAAEAIIWLSLSKVNYIQRDPSGVRLIETDCGAMICRAEGTDLQAAVLAALKEPKP